jgi:predicted small integral membrane protein
MKLSLAFLALTFGTAGSALAHHSFAAEFDGNKPIRIEGTLSKLEWTNPHSWFYVDVKDEAANVVNWGCEGASPGVLSRKGFQKGEAKLGDKLVVDGYAAKDGSHLMNARRIYLNGKLIFEQTEGEGQ